MKRTIVILVAFIFFSSCGSYFTTMNSDINKHHAEEIGNKYFQNKKNNSQISDFKLISVENAEVYLNKNKDTINEIYEMIYEVETNNVKDQFLVKIKKKGSNTKIKSTNIN